jgi:hypothetical protein
MAAGMFDGMTEMEIDDKMNGMLTDLGVSYDWYSSAAQGGVSNFEAAMTNSMSQIESAIISLNEQEAIDKASAAGKKDTNFTSSTGFDISGSGIKYEKDSNGKDTTKVNTSASYAYADKINTMATNENISAL